MLAIGSDHGGFELKQVIKKHLTEKGFNVKDYGAFCTESSDYPDYALPVSLAVSQGECNFGILICGTGIGISISANKVDGIRAANCTNSFMARMAREHNNANILALGARILGVDMALDIVDTFLSGEFQHGRHDTRVRKIMALENIKKSNVEDNSNEKCICS